MVEYRIESNADGGANRRPISRSWSRLSIARRDPLATSRETLYRETQSRRLIVIPSSIHPYYILSTTHGLYLQRRGGVHVHLHANLVLLAWVTKTETKVKFVTQPMQQTAFVFLSVLAAQRSTAALTSTAIQPQAPAKTVVETLVTVS